MVIFVSLELSDNHIYITIYFAEKLYMQQQQIILLTRLVN